MNFMGEVDVKYQRNSYSLSSRYALTGQGIESAFTWVCPHRTVSYEMSGSLDNRKASYDAEFSWEADKMVSYCD